MTTNTQATAFSDFNLEKVSTRELSDHIAGSLAIGSNIAVFGLRGTGKTYIAKQEIEKAKMKEVYLNLSVLERPDLFGYPRLLDAKQKEFVDFIMPQFYESMFDGKQEVCLLLDELDKADPAIWAPLLELTQFKSINGKPLPKLKSVISTGNLLAEGGSRPSLPLLDRTEKYLVEADATSWLMWAGKSGQIHPSVTAFINDTPNYLFGKADSADNYADPSPRGWHRASDILYAGEKLGWSTNMLNKKVSGCVGKDAGLRYFSYYEHYQQLLPMVEKIFKGESVKSEYQAMEPTKQIVACMIACARLAGHMDKTDESKPPTSINMVGKFLQNVAYENILIAVRSQIQVDRIIKFGLDENPEWSIFLNKIKEQVNGN